MFRNRQYVPIDLLPGIAVQFALVDTGNLIFDPHAQILRFKYRVVHDYIVPRGDHAPGGKLKSPTAQSFSDSPRRLLRSLPVTL